MPSNKYTCRKRCSYVRHNASLGLWGMVKTSANIAAVAAIAAIAAVAAVAAVAIPGMAGTMDIWHQLTY